MDSFIALLERFHLDKLVPFLMAMLLLGAGYFLAKLMAAAIARLLTGKVSVHNKAMAKRGGFYGVLALFSVSALNQLGFDISILLGAAGILTVALGFASQTSASNLISGLFLMFERPFEIKDVIHVADTTGEVISIDLLSVKLRTFDNLFVRIPNETMIRSEVTTLTRFPIRRIEIPLRVSFQENLDHVKQLLLALPVEDPRCMAEPEPSVDFQAFGDTALELRLLVWVKNENRIAVKNDLYQQIATAFCEHGIEVPVAEFAWAGRQGAQHSPSVNEE